MQECTQAYPHSTLRTRPYGARVVWTLRPPRRSTPATTPFPYTTLSRSGRRQVLPFLPENCNHQSVHFPLPTTRLNSSHTGDPLIPRSASKNKSLTPSSPPICHTLHHIPTSRHPCHHSIKHVPPSHSPTPSYSHFPPHPTNPH